MRQIKGQEKGALCPGSRQVYGQEGRLGSRVGKERKIKAHKENLALRSSWQLLPEDPLVHKTRAPAWPAH